MMNTNFTGRSIASDGTAWCTYSNALAKNVIVCGDDKLFKLGFNPPETRVYLIEMHG